MEGYELAQTIVLLAPFFTIVMVLPIALSFRFRRYKTLHETLRIMAEKGLPIPPELLNQPKPRSSQMSLLTSGLVCLAIGIGAMIFLFLEYHKNEWSLALIPSLVGIALLASWAVENRKTGRP